MPDLRFEDLTFSERQYHFGLPRADAHYLDRREMDLRFKRNEARERARIKRQQETSTDGSDRNLQP